MEPVEHAFMGGLAGFAAFVILDVGWFVMNHGAAPRSIASQLLGMPVLAFGSALPVHPGRHVPELAQVCAGTSSDPLSK